MTYCGERTIVNTIDRVRTAISLRCRSWHCPECAELRKKRLIAEAIGGAPNKFLTLTLRRSMANSPEEAAKVLTRAWRIVRLRLMRARKWKKLPFIAVFEPHESGWPHLHILLRCAWIDAHWLSQQMLDVCNSPVVKIKAIDHRGRVAGYCAKYCGKGASKFGTCKRYWQTPDYDLRPEPPSREKRHGEEAWTNYPWRLYQFVDAYKARGWIVEQQSMWKATARPPP